eukprot:5738838-Pleurochrysis_carterae.AAC.2
MPHSFVSNSRQADPKAIQAFSIPTDLPGHHLHHAAAAIPCLIEGRAGVGKAADSRLKEAAELGGAALRSYGPSRECRHSGGAATADNERAGDRTTNSKRSKAQSNKKTHYGSREGFAESRHRSQKLSRQAGRARCHHGSSKARLTVCSQPKVQAGRWAAGSWRPT